jgi:hypothetical protein
MTTTTRAPSQKVAAMTVPAALAVIYASLTRGTTDPATLGLAGLTILQFIIGYLTPHKPLTLSKPKPKPGPVVMFDSITPSTVPSFASTSADAVAGYIDGRWPDYAALEREFPAAHHLSIATNPNHDADCLDVENGDATVYQAPGWVRRQLHEGAQRPVVYCSISRAPLVLEQLAAAGIHRQQIRLWSAHYNGHEHICAPNTCGYNQVIADATQWTDRALGRDLDESLCRPGFF